MTTDIAGARREHAQLDDRLRGEVDQVEASAASFAGAIDSARSSAASYAQLSADIGVDRTAFLDGVQTRLERAAATVRARVAE